MTALTDADLRLLLAMVDRSGQVMAPDEHEDSFDDYTAIVLGTGTVPGFDPGRADESATGMLDVDIFLGVGLALLGQIGLQILTSLGELAVQRGARSVAGFVGASFRRRRVTAPAPGSGDGSGDGPQPGTSGDGPQPGTEDAGAAPALTAEAQQLVDAVTALISSAGPLTTDQIKVIVTIQLQAVADAADTR